MYVAVSNGLGAAAPARRAPRGAVRRPVAVPFVIRNGNLMVVVRPPGRRGVGDVPGCGPSSLAEAMGSFVQDAVDFPGQTPDPAGQALSLAQMLCSESGGGSVFGCPPMAGCDPASIQAMVSSITAQLAQNPTYQRAMANGGNLNPGYNPPIAPGSPYATPPPPPDVTTPPVVWTSHDPMLPPATPPPANVPASVSFQNTSRPGQAFQVGDSWQLTVSGASNAPVSATATQNGSSMGTTPFGSTDASGTLVLTGTFTSAQLGAWREMWTVGSSPAPVLAFSVVAAPAAPAPPPVVTPPPTSTPPPPSGGGGGGGTPPAVTTPLGGSLSSFFSQTFSLAGFNIPYWAAGAGIVGALFLFGGSRR